MSHALDPDEPDERQTSAQVVSLPTGGEVRTPRLLHGKRPPKSPRSKAASAAAIPPPPPMPADLAAAGIVVPPKPPLPARAPQDPAESAEPENTIHTEAPAE